MRSSAPIVGTGWTRSCASAANGTAKNALRLAKAGLNIVFLPKTIDNDVAETDATIGFARRSSIATEAIDRLHSTAHSHHRIILAEVMGHRAGWLTLGRGHRGRRRRDPHPRDPLPHRVGRRGRSGGGRSPGTNFSIVAVAEGAQDVDTNLRYQGLRRAGTRPAAARSATPPMRSSPRSTRTTPGTPCGSRGSWRR